MSFLVQKAEDLFCNDLPSTPDPEIGRVLVTGATGYIGGRLTPELLARGYKVRVLVRRNYTEYKSLWPKAEIAIGDAHDPESLDQALKGVSVAYYLIHSLLRGRKQFHAADIEAAVNFRRAADKAGVKRVIYLGGLGDLSSCVSEHLRSRMQVAEHLAGANFKLTILRAAVVIGSGSASYEIIHFLVNRLPVIFLPRWSDNQCQPIGVRDVIKYLVGVLEKPETTGNNYDIGGRDVLSYRLMLEEFASALNKKRIFLRYPSFSLPVYSYLASLVTPVPAPVTRSLMQGLKDEVVCVNHDIRAILPFEPKSYREAVARALTREEQDRVYTRWTDAYPPAHTLAIKLNEIKPEEMYNTRYALRSDKPASAIFARVLKIGGDAGWFDTNWMWRLRGLLDKLLSGVGSIRGRRSPTSLKINDVIDFWRVEDIKENRRLLLRAEMKLPGKAWLEFTIKEQDGAELAVTAYHYPGSFVGRLYWYLFLPFHHIIFRDLIEQIEQES